jgi:ATP-dependent DNA helicase RecG
MAGDPLDEPLTRVLGGRTATTLKAQLGAQTAGDLLTHYPRRYAERGKLTDLASLRVDERVTVLARVKTVVARRMQHRRGTLLEVVVTDGQADLSLTFFNQAWRERDLQPGRVGLFAGKVGSYRGKRQLAHPDYVILSEDAGVSPTARELFDTDTDAEPADVLDPEARDVVESFAGAIIPVYPATAKLASWRIAQCIRALLDMVDIGDVPDPLPNEVRAGADLIARGEALRLKHQPESMKDVSLADRRLRFDEAFVLQATLVQRRALARATPTTPRIARADGLLAAFDARLPFTLTDGQREIGDLIFEEIGQPEPMLRLLQGEVGSGKTVVALRAMLAVIDAGGQAALLAPTEVLAVQHHRSLTAMLGPLAAGGMLGGDEHATRVALLTGSMSTAARKSALLDAASGAAGIVVGTHAVLEDVVSFADLGLVVVDEQHRFGVEQRDTLRNKGVTPPHVLVMTATPIPRTIAMTVFGDLDVSTLRELPKGRSPIATHVVPAREQPALLDRTWQRIREEVAAGHRAFVVCPRIDPSAAGAADGLDDADSYVADPDSDDLDADDAEANAPRVEARSVLDTADYLRNGPLSDLRLGVLHGRLPSDEKDAVMSAFARGDLDVLVATTVIEVGVDVPEATVMVVMSADRFGVSQLHQLRGRVGRGSAHGLCLLVTDLVGESPARERIDAVAATTDGFELSRVDLRNRREGDVLGTSQSGRRSSLNLLRVLDDEDLIVEARAAAERVIHEDPQLTEHPELAAAIAREVDESQATFLDKA